ncbi:transcription factor Adf-1 [Caerostris extrusa]|uniref:Transcription factor Adf-1 n=1 Tax=Caerostris extrusa TaxID=172846 RepID=A0AAV4R6H3_CAEEX|nr:transcription factor Adf-1 [Caerostris extrusa]
MDKFIKAVKNNPCLWDMGHPAYKDFEVMDKCWVKVAAIANFPDAKAAKIQWKKLRDNFREALKRKKNPRTTLGHGDINAKWNSSSLLCKVKIRT